ncbi:hypothetical protein B9Z55_007134 [Caenorhabditis nigoni]|uniref:Uncharacterized protein n=1 Tax=Caenorhabditis nigoni TaxID=1611254 RepID=A0A2G5V8J8_9PELO|nr:hypothetical protein B9Z55_007134 [Caenorhabditis nigoni]
MGNVNFKTALTLLTMSQKLDCKKDQNVPLSEDGKKTMKDWKTWYEKLSSGDQEKNREYCQEPCDTYMDGESYSSWKTDTMGYGNCCDILNLCGGTSGWIIFLIILIVIGCLAAAGAAFYFFYWKRKMGGRDEEEKEVESGEDTTKSGYDISVDTY